MLVLAGSAMAGLVLAALALAAWRSGRRRLLRGLTGAMLALVAGYLAILVGVSAASEERILPPGGTKRFCGFYLDCHLGVSVDRAGTAATLGVPVRRVTASGTFRIVVLRISSDARAATLTPHRLRVVLVDGQGRRFPRHRKAERALLGAEADLPLEQPVSPATAYTRTLVFDLPVDVTRPALLVTEGGLLDALVERFLIGDEDSLFHRPTLLGLSPRQAVAGRRPGAAI